MSPNNLLSLPTEIHLQVLVLLKPSPLFKTLRLVNKHFHSCVESLFHHDLLRRLELELFLNIGDGCVCLVGGYLEKAGDLGNTVKYKLRASNESHMQDRAVDALSAGMRRRSETLMMRVCLSPSYLIWLRGREWQDCMVKSEEIESGVLEVDWRKLVSVYFKATDLFDDIADGTSGRGHVSRTRFPMY